MFKVVGATIGGAFTAAPIAAASMALCRTSGATAAQCTGRCQQGRGCGQRSMACTTLIGGAAAAPEVLKGSARGGGLTLTLSVAPARQRGASVRPVWRAHARPPAAQAAGRPYL